MIPEDKPIPDASSSTQSVAPPVINTPGHKIEWFYLVFGVIFGPLGALANLAEIGIDSCKAIAHRFSHSPQIRDAGTAGKECGEDLSNLGANLVRSIPIVGPIGRIIYVHTYVDSKIRDLTKQAELAEQKYNEYSASHDEPDMKSTYLYVNYIKILEALSNLGSAYGDLKLAREFSKEKKFYELPEEIRNSSISEFQELLEGHKVLDNYLKPNLAKAEWYYAKAIKSEQLPAGQAEFELAKLLAQDETENALGFDPKVTNASYNQRVIDLFEKGKDFNFASATAAQHTFIKKVDEKQNPLNVEDFVNPDLIGDAMKWKDRERKK